MNSQTRDYIWHSNQEAEAFISGYFNADKNTLFIGSVGFDPRTFRIFKVFKETTQTSLVPIFTMEQRVMSSEPLAAIALTNFDQLSTILGTTPDVKNIQIFAEDRALIGGRRIVEMASKLDIKSHTDIVIDISAMSRGIFFPLVRFLRERIKLEASYVSLHLLVVDHPRLDYSYLPEYEDKAAFMHGFDGGVQRVGVEETMRLWVPQLASGRAQVYDQIFAMVKPSDVCPVLPFPGVEAKMVDELASEYRTQILDAWNTDLNNIVLAAESDPLDLYHTMIRVDKARKSVFAGILPTITVLSPLGTKVSTIGGLLAAMDLDLPVAYVETSGYNPTQEPPDGGGELVHVWVDGPVYN